jgi:uncharacterized membrane protein
MKHLAVLVLVVIIGFVGCVSEPILPDIGPDDPCPPGLISFQKEILPLVASGCAFSGCHDAQTAEEDVILDSYENIMKEVVPGKPNRSPLYEYLIADPDDIMPPPPYSAFTQPQIDLIKNWILQGALNVECGECDTTNISFINHIYPIVQNQCMLCHSDTRQDGGVNLANYSLIKQSIQSGAFMGTINHETGYSPMPPSGIKMDQCAIDQLNVWINQGMPEN